MRLHANQPIGTVPRARALRREAPAPERRLLRALREAFPTLKWRHQAPVGPFFADILCFSERLVIEVDGDTHANAEVMNDIESVLAVVSLRLQGRRNTHACLNEKGDAA